MTGDATPEANKALVTEFMRLFYNEKDYERAGELLADDFVNHHTGVGRGRGRTIETFSKAVASLPDFALTVRRVLADGDLVATHSHVKAAPGAPDVVVADFWRVAGGRLVEHWDVGAAVPEGSTLEDELGDAR
jgi:predicted SnoaL-like aldol condensation-catalyzing enzyme